MARVTSHVSTMILRIWITQRKFVLMILVIIIKFCLNLVNLLRLYYFSLITFTEVLHNISYCCIFIYISWVVLTFFSFVRFITILIHSITIGIRFPLFWLLLYLTIVKHFHQININISRYATHTSCLYSHMGRLLGSTSWHTEVVVCVIATAALDRFFVLHANATHAGFR